MVESWQWWMVGDPLHTFCLVQFQRRQSDRQTLVFAPPALIPCSFPYGINPRRGEELSTQSLGALNSPEGYSIIDGT